MLRRGILGVGENGICRLEKGSWKLGSEAAEEKARYKTQVYLSHTLAAAGNTPSLMLLRVL